MSKTGISYSKEIMLEHKFEDIGLSDNIIEIISLPSIDNRIRSHFLGHRITNDDSDIFNILHKHHLKYRKYVDTLDIRTTSSSATIVLNRKHDEYEYTETVVLENNIAKYHMIISTNTIECLANLDEIFDGDYNQIINELIEICEDSNSISSEICINKDLHEKIWNMFTSICCNDDMYNQFLNYIKSEVRHIKNIIYIDKYLNACHMTITTDYGEYVILMSYLHILCTTDKYVYDPYIIQSQKVVYDITHDLRFNVIRKFLKYLEENQ